MIANKNALINFFSRLSCSGKKFKISWKTKGELREFSFSKMWSPCHGNRLIRQYLVEKHDRRDVVTSYLSMTRNLTQLTSKSLLLEKYWSNFLYFPIFGFQPDDSESKKPGGHHLERSHYLNLLSAVGRVFPIFMSTQGPILKFLSILGHNFFICPL